MASVPQNSMAKESGLHIAMFPWLAYGHLIPFLELSKFLARKGHRISFISTSKNIDRLQIPPDLSSSITFVKISLPHAHGLPENVEGTMDIHPDQVAVLKNAYDGMETELTRFLEDSSTDVVIYDFAPYWLGEAAAKLGIYRVFFCVFNAWFLGFMGPTDGMINPPGPRTKLEDFLMPPKWVPFETKTAYKPYEVMRIYRSVQKNPTAVSDLLRIGKGIVACDVIIIRHCYEFEGDWLKLLEDLHHKPVVPLGLMPPAVHISNSDDDETWVRIRTWLDGQKKGSALYVALGTELSLSQIELSELALGLELSGVPFFWTLKKPALLTEAELAELPEGLEERVKDRSVVWKSWAPQSRILSHDSVGGFLTHCGWNSTIEALMHGHPLIMLPFQVDQGLNARVLEDRQLGVEIQRSEWEGTYTKDSVAQSVKSVMVEDEGKKYRDKAKEIGSIFGDRKLHDSYMDKFIEFLESNARRK